MRLVRLYCAVLAIAASAYAATFGTVVALVGGASDIVLDEGRSRVYLVNPTQGRVEVYSIPQRRFLTPIKTEATPISAAMSKAGKTLYVTSYDASALDVIDLDTSAVVDRVSLPVKPEGIAVGSDDRVVISTIGSGTGNASNVLLVYDPNAAGGSTLRSVDLAPPAPANPVLPPPSGRIYLASRSQLIANRDGSIIVGSNAPNAAGRAVFVYEVASGTVLRSRILNNISSVLAVSPDGTRFMSGLSLLDSSTLEIVAQENASNAPYPFDATANFNTQTNQGGSVFSPDGSALYAAFDIAPSGARPNVSQLLFNDPENLLIRMGLQLPENLAGKMVISSDGGTVYALSESGFVIIPVGQVFQNPVATVDSNTVLLANDQCGVTAGMRNATIAVQNAGRGRLTASAQLAPGSVANTAPSVRAQNTATGANLSFTFTPAAAARAPGTVTPAHAYLIQSPEAINIPPAVRVFQNFRDSEARADLLAVPVNASQTDGLVDIAYDTIRQRIYMANAGLNRVEVFDTRSNQLLAPIKVGQLPRSLAISPDGNVMYVANTGGESISIVDLDKGQQVDRVHFPPLPFNFNAALVTPSIVAVSLRGPMVLMNNGTIWKIVGNQAIPRNVSALIGSATVPAPRSMAATPNGEAIIILSGNGFVYLYDPLADDFVQGRQVFSGAIQGYYGPITAGPRGQYYVVNGTVLNSALTPLTGSGSATRPVSAVAVVSGSTYARFTQPVRANPNAPLQPTDLSTIEIVDVATGAVIRTANLLEGPLTTVAGGQRATVDGRTMVVDPAGSTAYALTTSGLSSVSLDAPNPADRPVPNNGGIVSAASYLPSFAPGSIIAAFGRNLGDTTIGASSVPLPTILGGACVTLNNQPLPLYMASPGQINAQIPVDLQPGRYPLIVRAIDRKAASGPQQITITKYAPAVFTAGTANEAAVYHQDGRQVSKDNPAHRDEPLVMYGSGLGVTKGGNVTTGGAAPVSPLAVSDPISLFFGDPRIKESGIIVDWSGLAPGFVGLYQINLRVPGDHIRGDTVPVTLRIGGVDSQKTGPAVPVIAID